ncbi:MAG: helix-turn-helix domain-containing protein [Olsenella sp.]|nr:helix-turn-helix domain-containing protein [Olsenella sp.]
MREWLVDYRFVRRGVSLQGDRWRARICYALRGSALLDMAGSSPFEISEHDGALAVVNAAEAFDLKPLTDCLVLVCDLDMRLLRRMLNDRPVRFACNPTLRHQEAYGALERNLDAFVRSLAETGDLSRLYREAAELGVVRCLMDGFSSAQEVSAIARGDAFMEYIDSHFDEPLSLSDAAKRFNLSPEHFARLFKREVGSTFLSYLTSVRLDVATRRLTSTSETVTRIALESDFPNIASFNNAFRSAYSVTPTEYRRKHEMSEERGGECLPECLDADPVGETVASERIDLLCRADDIVELPWRPWLDMIGLGAIDVLDDARVRDQVRWLCTRVGFERCCVTCDAALLETPAGLHRLQDCLDFLLDAGLSIHMVFESDGSDVAGEVTSIERMLRTFSNRYSISNVRRWRFELRYSGAPSAIAEGAYLDLFASASALLERMSADTGLVGPGVSVARQSQDLRTFLESMRARGIVPGAVSVACHPAVPLDGEGAMVRTADRFYMRNQLLGARETLAREGFDPGLLMVSGWDDSLESHNAMNDSCYEGAHACQTLLSCRDLVQSVCYDWALDRLCPTNGDDSDFRPLSGKPGLITRDGIPKPSFYAFEFLGHIGPRVIFADDRGIASVNKMGNYQIVCHNCERLGARYLTTPESLISFEEMSGYFEGPASRLAHVRIDGARPGTYLVKKRFVNASDGSVADAASRMRLWCMDDPSRGEIEYLRSHAHPQMELETVLADGGTIEFSHELSSNEMAYFHVIYLY